MTRRLARLAVIALLVSSVFAVAATGSAAAYEDYGSCVEDRGAGWTLTCFVSYADLQSTDAGDSVETQSDAYFDKSSIQNNLNNIDTVSNNSRQSVRSMAYRLAEAEYAKAIANGSSKTEAKSAASERATEYIGNQINNNIAYEVNDIASRIMQMRQQSGVNVEDYGDADNIQSAPETNITVFPNSQHPTSFNVTDIESTDARYSWFPSYTAGSTQGYDHVHVHFSSSDYSDGKINTRTSAIANRVTQYEDIRTEIVNEIATFSDSINESQYDNLSASDIPSPLTQATEFGQEYNDTGSSGYASALAAHAGYGSDVGTAYHVETLDTGTHYNGTLYGDYDDFPNGSIEVNKTYDGSTMTVWLNPNNGDEFDINSDFKVHGIELSDGNVTNSTALSNYERQSLNASAPIDTLDEWRQLSDSLSDDGTGPGIFGGSGSMLAIVALLGVIGGVYLMSKQNGGNGGNYRTRRNNRGGRR